MTRASLALVTAILLPAACAPAPASPPRALAEPGSSTLAQAARAADDERGFLERVETVGDACGESAVTSISPDGQAFTTIFSDFVAAAGRGTPDEQASRGCLIMANVAVPAGWQYSIEDLIYRGFVALEDRVSADRSSLYIISGNGAQTPPAQNFEGEIEGEDYVHSDVGPDRPSGWSPCGGGQNLWIAVRAEVDNDGNDNRDGQLTVDSVDADLLWRRCQ